MRLSLGICSFPLCSVVLQFGLVIAVEPVFHIPNANHVFNAVHDSLRQFNSLIHRNGMSIFAAQVPAGTELYHGTIFPTRIVGTEWLAFEPEHAMMLARPGLEPPFRDRNPRLQKQNPLSLSRDDGPDDESEHGYFHTYRAKQDLNVIYLDGHSATWWMNGTSDTQDCVLLFGSPKRLNDSQTEIDFGRDACFSYSVEEDRVRAMCDRVGEQWNGAIDGFIRMEGGFELILCDFGKTLDLLSIDQSRLSSAGGRFSDTFNVARAIAARYSGIGDSRVQLDFEDFFSTWTFPESIFFDRDEFPHINASSPNLSQIYAGFQKMLRRPHKTHGRNWQAITDLIVTRYSDRLDILSMPNLFLNLTVFRKEVERALRPFINYADRNVSREISRCANQFLPYHTEDHISESMIFRATLNVTTEICSTLQRALRSQNLKQGVQFIQELQRWLSWSTWKGCHGCAMDQLCYIPVFPRNATLVGFQSLAESISGTGEDWRTPRCVSGETVDGIDRYLRLALPGS